MSSKSQPRLTLNRETVAKLTVRTMLRTGGLPDPARTVTCNACPNTMTRGGFKGGGAVGCVDKYQ
jgi:hypothetical protein